MSELTRKSMRVGTSELFEERVVLFDDPIFWLGFDMPTLCDGPSENLFPPPILPIGFNTSVDSLPFLSISPSSLLVAFRPSVFAIAIFGAGLREFVVLTVAVKGNGCREQTSLVSTSEERSNAQKSCAPVSRDASRFLAASRKSHGCIGSSRSSGKLD